MSPGVIGTMEIVFLILWGIFSLLYWAYYRKSENPIGAALKVGLLFGFVYSVMLFFDWSSKTVPPDQVKTFWGFLDKPASDAARVPYMEDVFMWFVIALLALVAWYARRKFTTVIALMLSAWDRGHWYMLPVIFILVTIGLALVAAAASPVLSPFIYTLF